MYLCIVPKCIGSSDSCPRQKNCFRMCMTERPTLPVYLPLHSWAAASRKSLGRLGAMVVAMLALASRAARIVGCRRRIAGRRARSRGAVCSGGARGAPGPPGLYPASVRRRDRCRPRDAARVARPFFVRDTSVSLGSCTCARASSRAPQAVGLGAADAGARTNAAATGQDVAPPRSAAQPPQHPAACLHTHAAGTPPVSRDEPAAVRFWRCNTSQWCSFIGHTCPAWLRIRTVTQPHGDAARTRGAQV